MEIQKIRKLVMICIVLEVISIISMFPLQVNGFTRTTLTSAPVEQKLVFLLRIAIQLVIMVILALFEYKKPSRVKSWLLLISVLGIGLLDSHVFFNKNLYLHYGLFPLALIGVTIYLVIYQYRYSSKIKKSKV